MEKEPMMIVLFGPTGDLSRRKLIPALFNLYTTGALHEYTTFVGVGRRKLTKEEFITLLDSESYIPHLKRDAWKTFLSRLHYQAIDYGTKTPEELKEALDKIEHDHGCGNNKLMYLALPPDIFSQSVDLIKRSGILKGEGWRRIVFEKPFGTDLKSAKHLNKKVCKVFKEDAIFRIDHYLGKELVQNIMVFRFANALFEQTWNSHFIDHVQITIAEQDGVEQRAGYYDQAGAARDMLQSHLLQLLMFIAMEPPKSYSAEDIRTEKIVILNALRGPKKGCIVIGQYEKGKIEGKETPGYRAEEGIPEDSATETFIALKAGINNKRWKEVPFYLRTGKRMAKKYANIDIIYRDDACTLFCGEKHTHQPNRISIRIQPDEGISVTFNIKPPGAELKLSPVTMDFCHTCLYALNTPEAYETLFQEIIKGDQTLFPRWDSVEASWRFIDQIEKLIKFSAPKTYPSGSLGPKEADELLEKDKRKWINP
ncbi:MAG: glucose-6-phosphate dehydrogenase [Nanoarchaeota archaeon]